MSDITTNQKAPRDSAAECHIRAAADRLRADGMDTRNGRRKFEQSAASWDVRGELLGRLEASFSKRTRLDEEAARFDTARRAEGLMPDASAEGSEDEGGATRLVQHAAGTPPLGSR